MNTNNYTTLLKPLQIGDFTLKNRIYASNSMPHFLQGPESYPAESSIAHLAGRAKSGASIVTISCINTTAGMPEHLPDNIDISHFSEWNLYDPQSQNYLMQLADRIHFYQSYAIVGLFAAGHTYPLRNPDDTLQYINAFSDREAFSSDEKAPKDQPVLSMDASVDDSISLETLELIAQSFAQQAALLQQLGFDGITLHMCYRGQLLGQFLSPITNHRTDHFGGSIEGRSNYPLYVLKKIREAVGPRFLIEVQISGEEEHGNTIEDTVYFLRKCEGLVDIAQIRADEVDKNHPTGYTLEETPFLELATKIKAAGVPMAVSAIAGFQDPSIMEQALIDNKVDLFAMARTWISNPGYISFLEENRADDIIPCLRCNKCHGRGAKDPFITVCSVNPVLGYEHCIHEMPVASSKSKKVAIIGGGPAGMRTALMLKEKGHFPEIYEASNTLGGAICHSDFADFKWPLRDYKNYLIHQLEKQNIPVHLSTKATPAMIKNKSFDTVVTALGATPSIPPIKGLDQIPYTVYKEAFSSPENLGSRVVIIGGGEVGCEIGIHLARHGHHCTILEMKEKLAAESTLIHYYSIMESAWNQEQNFHGITSASVLEVTSDYIEYKKDGQLIKLPYDSLVLSTGLKAKKEEALSFYDCAPQYFNIGDSNRPGTIQQVNRDSLSVVCRI